MHIIYILSSGHSGSTVIGSLLGNTKNSFHIGEFANFYKVYSGQHETCSCNELPEKCDYWSKVLVEFSTYLSSLNKDIHYYEELRQRVENTILRRKTVEKDFVEYSKITKKLFEIISTVSGKRIIIDSSKSPGRGLALSKVFFKEFHFVLIKRSLFEVIESFQRKRKSLNIYRFVYLLVREHLKLVYTIYISNSEFVRFDFKNLNVQSKVNLLLSRLNIDSKINLNDKIYNYHVIAGNRLRYQRFFYINPGEYEIKIKLSILQEIWILFGELIRKI